MECSPKSSPLQHVARRLPAPRSLLSSRGLGFQLLADALGLIKVLPHRLLRLLERLLQLTGRMLRDRLERIGKLDMFQHLQAHERPVELGALLVLEALFQSISDIGAGLLMNLHELFGRIPLHARTLRLAR